MVTKRRRPRHRVLAPAARPSRAVDPRHVRKVIAHAIKVGLHAFHYGSCGPAAIAINKVLFGGRASYVIATCKSAFEEGRMRGHVALHYDGDFYDYKGKCSVAEMLKYVRGDEFVVISDVPERMIRGFFPGQPSATAERILEQAIEDIRKRRCAAAIRQHERELAETRDSRKWSSRHPTVKAVAKFWKSTLDARRPAKIGRGQKRKKAQR